ncbi:hypothetical protein SDC9_209855 [bioreactor metagenome]|uniref:Uncharacterized protein n=1 Tax=bioreactor metagenome TaxID=1076179 RepID=A0A645JEG7_9ZZZZ
MVGADGTERPTSVGLGEPAAGRQEWVEKPLVVALDHHPHDPQIERDETQELERDVASRAQRLGGRQWRLGQVDDRIAAAGGFVHGELGHGHSGISCQPRYALAL